MKHLNGHLLCAIDCETTGLKAGYHDIVQICILPLDSQLKPSTKILPFYMDLSPKFPERAEPEALRVNKLDLTNLINNGMEPYKAADLFEEWFERLKLPFRKKIAPLGHNYTFDRAFLLAWLGDETYNDFFDYHIRDTATSALFCNDYCDFHNEKYPFPKFSLTYLASQLKVEHGGAHDSLNDCRITAEVYRRMMHTFLGQQIKATENHQD